MLFPPPAVCLCELADILSIFDCNTGEAEDKQQADRAGGAAAA
jgi:hypothetical protein